MLNGLKIKIGEKLNRIKDNKVVAFLDHLIYKINKDKIFPRGGMLSYFIILSIFPFAIALLNLLNLTPLADLSFIYLFIEQLPKEAQTVLVGFIREINTTSSAGLFSVSIIGGLWSASAGIRHLMRSLNNAYEFKETRNFITLRIVALIFTVALILMIILLLLTQIFSQRILSLIARYIHLNSEVLLLIHNLSFAIPLLYMVLIFSALYKFSPNQAMRKNFTFKSVVPGAVFSTLGIIAMTGLFTAYVNNFAKYSITYGSIAGIIITLVWLYLLSIIILIGGEINATIFYMEEKGLQWPREESILKNVFNMLGMQDKDQELP